MFWGLNWHVVLGRITFCSVNRFLCSNLFDGMDAAEHSVSRCETSSPEYISVSATALPFLTGFDKQSYLFFSKICN